MDMADERILTVLRQSLAGKYEVQGDAAGQHDNGQHLVVDGEVAQARQRLSSGSTISDNRSSFALSVRPARVAAPGLIWKRILFLSE
jgi:hypothetical protein